VVLIEDESDKMKKLRNEIAKQNVEAHVPDLIFIEIANLLRYSKINEKDISLAIRALMQIGLIIHRFEELIYDAIKLAIEKNITVYDSLYVALSNLIDSPLITYDEILLKSIDKAKKASEIVKF
jgi:Predicted nucleic acid-binding protein, contains PIN domain